MTYLLSPPQHPRLGDSDGIPSYAPPSIVEPFLSLVIAIVSNKELAVRERELAILADTSAFHPAYMTDAHTGVGTEVGFSSDQIAAACSGKTPQGLSEDEGDRVRVLERAGRRKRTCE